MSVSVQTLARAVRQCGSGRYVIGPALLGVALLVVGGLAIYADRDAQRRHARLVASLSSSSSALIEDTAALESRLSARPRATFDHRWRIVAARVLAAEEQARLRAREAAPPPEPTNRTAEVEVASVTPPAPAAPPPPPRVAGVLNGARSVVALVNGRLVEEGGRIEGYRAVSIQPGQVVFEDHRGQRIAVTVHRSVNP